MDVISWISQIHIAIKLSGLVFIVYGFYAMVRLAYIKAERDAVVPLLLGGSSLAMGLLIFILGFTQFLVGKEGL